MNDFQDQKIIALCDKCASCPTLERQENQVLIRDDFGGKVVLAGDQWNILVRLIEQKQFANWVFEPSSSQ